MFKVIGKLVGKSLIKEGVSGEGRAWKIVQFLIEKTKNKKLIKIPFIAKGKLAEKVETIPYGERIKIEFFIKGSEYNKKWFTDAIATDVDKFVSKKKYEHGSVSYNNEAFNNADDFLNTDLQLFSKENTETKDKID
ncbi:MAG TPA: DUF3127 domain-containing protein [Bacteroidia bacterium]|jgi:hypothetical protein|nr:DUF3127 domain-containing protein [Bacteroidia bacterium]